MIPRITIQHLINELQRALDKTSDTLTAKDSIRFVLLDGEGNEKTELIPSSIALSRHHDTGENSMALMLETPLDAVRKQLKRIIKEESSDAE